MNLKQLFLFIYLSATISCQGEGGVLLIKYLVCYSIYLYSTPF